MAGFALLLTHLSLVAWVSLRPLDVMWVNAANLTPFAGIRADLALGPLEATRRIGEGLLLLAPVGVLLPMAGGRIAVSFWASLTRTVTAGALLAIGIEMVQTAVPGRVLDVDSVLLHTAGVALAHLAVVPAFRARLRRPQGGPRQGSQGGSQGSERGQGTRRSREGRRNEWAWESARRGAAPLREHRGRDENPQGATPTIPRVGIAP
ncbi:VanZ family protein [Streptomyces sp. NPDC093085]|uniref:VanZ family protein n=1 Tax=Streptomyces sp. NPDC093085 TaxID=3155068 RepID=UPI00342E90C0